MSRDNVEKNRAATDGRRSSSSSSEPLPTLLRRALRVWRPSGRTGRRVKFCCRPNDIAEYLPLAPENWYLGAFDE